MTASRQWKKSKGHYMPSALAKDPSERIRDDATSGRSLPHSGIPNFRCIKNTATTIGDCSAAVWSMYSTLRENFSVISPHTLLSSPLLTSSSLDIHYPGRAQYRNNIVGYSRIHAIDICIPSQAAVLVFLPLKLQQLLSSSSCFASGTHIHLCPVNI